MNSNTITLGTERMIIALKLLDNPQYNYQVIHIAGSNGKGSTAAFIEAGLITAGFKVGKFTSPYIHRFNQSICLNYQEINELELIAITQYLSQQFQITQLDLSCFELQCLIMFYYFSQKKIDYLVLEVGMGGLTDATNVVNSCISIITNISLEHKDFLGDSLTAIAQHKCGIIKDGYTIIADNTKELLIELKEKTYYNVLSNYHYDTILNFNDFTTELIITTENTHSCNLNFKLSLFGNHQVLNFLCAYSALRYLSIDLVTIQKSCSTVNHLGRLSIINKNPLIAADATHNLAGVKTLYQTLKQGYDKKDIILICSILSDKPILEMLYYYAKLSDTIVLTTIPDNLRSSELRQLYHYAKLVNFKNIYLTNDPQDAKKYLGTRNLSLISGSIYLLKYFIPN